MNSILGHVVWGTFLLAVCSVIHVALITLSIRAMPHVVKWERRLGPHLRIAITVGTAFAMVVGAHLVQVSIWAVVMMILGKFETAEPAVYFAMVTYTTLGYGDIVLGPELRLFASFAAVTGLLTFGLSTAFLVGLFGRLVFIANGPQGPKL